MTGADVLIRLRAAGVEVWLDGESLRYRAAPGVLTPERLDWLRAHRDALVEGLRNRGHRDARALPEREALAGMTAHGAMPLKQAMMAATMPMLIQKAMVEGDIENGVMATGVVGGRIREVPSCQQLVDSIMAEARARLAALGIPAAAPVTA